eukprot:355912-Chlamydomonas_euryale.AAC.6
MQHAVPSATCCVLKTLLQRGFCIHELRKLRRRQVWRRIFTVLRKKRCGDRWMGGWIDGGRGSGDHTHYPALELIVASVRHVCPQELLHGGGRAVVVWVAAGACFCPSSSSTRRTCKKGRIRPLFHAACARRFESQL